MESPRLHQLISAAAERGPGVIARVEGWAARAGRRSCWVAVEPDGLRDQARDLVDGLVHERALWDGTAEPMRTRVAATAALLGAAHGTPLPRSPASAWNRRIRELAPLFALPMAPPECLAAGALDPGVTLLLAAELGESFDAAGEQLRLRLRSGTGGHVLLKALPQVQDNLVNIT